MDLTGLIFVDGVGFIPLVVVVVVVVVVVFVNADKHPIVIDSFDVLRGFVDSMRERVMGVFGMVDVIELVDATRLMLATLLTRRAPAL